MKAYLRGHIILAFAVVHKWERVKERKDLEATLLVEVESHCLFV